MATSTGRPRPAPHEDKRTRMLRLLRYAWAIRNSPILNPAPGQIVARGATDLAFQQVIADVLIAMAFNGWRRPQHLDLTPTACHSQVLSELVAMLHENQLLELVNELAPGLPPGVQITLIRVVTADPESMIHIEVSIRGKVALWKRGFADPWQPTVELLAEGLRDFLSFCHHMAE